MALARTARAFVARRVAPAARLSTANNDNNMETDEYIIFPRERPGLDYSLNWSLNKNGVTPSGDAFRITKASEGAKFGTVAAAAAASKKAVAAAEAGSDALSYGDFEGALEAAKTELSSSPMLYVAEGDAAKTRVMCRVITNCGDGAASAMGLVLERAPRPAEAAELPLTVFYTPNAPHNFAGFVVEQGDGVIYPSEAVVADVVLSGARATPADLAATLAAAAEELQK